MSVEQARELNRYLTGNVVPRTLGALERAFHTRAVDAAHLRTHQVDTIDKITEVLASGQTAFHIAEATGVGKTAIALQLAQTLMPELRFDDNDHDPRKQHGVAIFVSPTKDILTQTHEAAERFAPGVTVTDYYGDRKDISGMMINTTYQSLPTLLNDLEKAGRHVRLLIGDEVHTAIGTKRYQALGDPKLDSAIMLGLTATPYFDQLDTLIERGQVQEDERWVGMFRNQAHEISISDGIEMGILSPLDIHVFHTNIAADFHISNGEYSASEVDSFVRQQGRSMMAVAMVAGMEGVQKLAAARGIEVKLGDKVAEIAEVHEKVKGKQTLLFGSTKEHIREVREMLIAAGIPEHEIGLIHGEMNKTQRDAVKQAFQEKKIKYLLGIRVLGVGIDLPEAEVGIFMVPKLSPIDVEQELGRIMRLVDGKRATAIQLVDDYPRTRPPILLPQVLDPEVVLQYMPQSGQASPRRTGTESAVPGGEEKGKITITGLSVEAFQERIRSEQYYQQVLLGVQTIEDLGRVLDSAWSKAQERAGDLAEPIDLYEELIRLLPERTHPRITKLILDNLLSPDVTTAKIARHALITMHLKTIVRVANEYREDYDASDLVHEVIATVLQQERLQTVANGKTPISTNFNRAARTVIEGAVVDDEVRELTEWVDKGLLLPIQRYVEAHLVEMPDPSPEMVNNWIANMIGEIEGLDEDAAFALRQYIQAKVAVMAWDPKAEFSDEPFNELLDAMLEVDAVQGVLQGSWTGLTQRELEVLQLRFGLGEEGEELTLEEVGRILKVSRDRIRQLEERAIRRLRHPKATARLKGSIPPADPAPVYPTFEESMERAGRMERGEDPDAQEKPVRRRYPWEADFDWDRDW